MIQAFLGAQKTFRAVAHNIELLPITILSTQIYLIFYILLWERHHPNFPEDVETPQIE